MEILSASQGKTMLGSMSRKESAFKVLISTILSARTKDTATYPIAQKLFRKYKTPEDFLRAPVRQLEKEIYGIGFYRVKARRLKKVCRMLLEKHSGKVPDNMEELLQLPGVGRKTANCVLVYAFRRPAIPVDVHVHRISNRIGLVKAGTPEETEMQLMKLVPERMWIKINDLLVHHGQATCTPQSPFCSRCSIYSLCERRSVARSR